MLLCDLHFLGVFTYKILEMRTFQKCMSSPGGVSEKTHEHLRNMNSRFVGRLLSRMLSAKVLFCLPLPVAFQKKT